MTTAHFPDYILINEKVFKKQEGKPFHNFVRYTHSLSQQQVKVQYSDFYSGYQVWGRSRGDSHVPYYVLRESLFGNITMKEEFIDTYFTKEQDEVLDKAVSEVLSRVWDVRKY